MQQLTLFPPMRTCVACGQDKPPEDFVTIGRKTGRCAACRAEHNQQAHKTRVREANLRIKAEVMACYGGVCACCGESSLDCLEIDHVEGNGKAHRAELRAQGMSLAAGPQFYYWLRRNGYPGGFQVLCEVCNRAKGAMSDTVFKQWLQRVKVKESKTTLCTQM